MVVAFLLAMLTPGSAQDRQQIASTSLSNLSVYGDRATIHTFMVPAGSRVTEIETDIGVTHYGNSYGSETVMTLIAPDGQQFQYRGEKLGFEGRPGYYRASSRLQVSPPVLNAGGIWSVELSDRVNDRANPDYITDASSGIVLFDLADPEVSISESAVALPIDAAITPIQATATGGTGSYRFTISPALPAGLELGAESGAITGTPTAASPATSYTITAADSRGLSGTATLSLAVSYPPLGLTLSDSYLRLTRDVALLPVITSTVTGGSGSVTFDISPSLPAGLDFDAATGTISGTPAAVSAATVYTITATDESGPSISALLTIVVENDDARVAEAFEQATTRFMAARIDRMLAAEPRSYRLENRGDSSAHGITSRSTQDGTDLSLSGGRLSADGLWFLWIEGESADYRYSHDNETSRKGTFGLVSMGFDYLLTPDLTIGMMGQLDRMSETTQDASDISGTGWMVGPYIAGRFSDDLYYTARLAYGRSNNDAAVDVFGADSTWFQGKFDTERSLARASIYGLRDLSSGVTMSPKLDLAWMRENQQDYLVSDGISRVAVQGMSVEVWRLMLSSRFEGQASPNLRAFVEPSLAWDFAASGYEQSEDVHGAVEFGLRSDALSAWQSLVALRYEGIGADDREAVAVRLNLNSSF